MLVTALLVSVVLESPAQQSAPAVVVLELKGVIGVAAARFVADGIDTARQRDARAVIIRMDTPGGLVSATRDITSAILASAVPVVVYVAPSGARAASAGTYITYAAHIAAMAPGTHIGAATPISLGGPPGLPGSEPERKPKDKSAEPANAGEQKALNDAIAYMRTLAQLRGRNVEFAEQAVRSAATMTAREALEAKVVDVIADSVPALLDAIDGRKVSVSGVERALSTKGATIVTLAPDWRSQAIGIITDPNVAYILLLIGFYGILFEFWNPGFVFPGVAGGICLLLALAALAVMPVSYAGLALILLGLGLMIAEVFTPGVFVLGIGGVVAFVVGSIFLFDARGLSFDFGVAWPIIAAATVTTAGFLVIVLGFALKARRRPVVTGVEQMIGSPAKVIEWSGTAGRVHVHGEAWAARAASGLPALPAAGTVMRIVAVDGLTVLVEPVDRPATPAEVTHV